jgi:hypothetical protein
MKLGGFTTAAAICLVWLTALSAGSVEAYDAVVLESIVLESFDGDSNFDWRLDASKYTNKTNPEDVYPKVSYIEAYPQAAHLTPPAEGSLRSLGINGSFTRYGYNWIDVYPINKESPDAGPAEIALPGNVKFVDLWVWGANMNYSLEAYIRDYQGMIYTIPVGALNFKGWKNLRAAIPNALQSRLAAPRLPAPTAGDFKVPVMRSVPQKDRQFATFVKFRIWTSPEERVDSFYTYFDNIKVLTDNFEAVYDGDDLATIHKTRELWGSAPAGAQE